jgi:hypothetical protein
MTQLFGLIELYLPTPVSHPPSKAASPSRRMTGAHKNTFVTIKNYQNFGKITLYKKIRDR